MGMCDNHLQREGGGAGLRFRGGMMELRRDRRIKV